MKTCSILLLLTYSLATAFSQEDNQAIINDMNALKNNMSAIERTLQQQNLWQQQTMDSLSAWYQGEQESLILLLNQLADQQESLHRTDTLLATLHHEMHLMRHEQQNDRVMHLIGHGFSLVLVLFLILYILIQRQKSLDFLLSRTNKLAGQNDEILAKANELKAIKKSLKELLERRKKANNTNKKKKKK